VEDPETGAAVHVQGELLMIPVTVLETDIGVIEINRGSSTILGFNLARDITGYANTLYIKALRTDSDAAALVTIVGTVTSLPLGVGHWHITTTHTTRDRGDYSLTWKYVGGGETGQHAGILRIV
jgi:hypothetical protein